jgi:uncharacterized protein (DUF1810 family)
MTTETNGEAADPYHLQRFIDAQASCFAHVRSELLAGQKQTHWMWFVFPQWKGLGSSPITQRFAISSPGEANAYLLHPVLGDRLRDCTALVNAVNGRSAHDIFGYPDSLKFHSSVTLFAWVVQHGSPFQMLGNHVFAAALKKYFNGKPDQATIDRLPPTGTDT